MFFQRNGGARDAIDDRAALERRRAFCVKYLPALERIDRDEALKQACRDYWSFNGGSRSDVERFIYEDFMPAAYDAGMVIGNYRDLVEENGIEAWVGRPSRERLMAQDADHVLACIAYHFRADHFSNGSLISDSVAGGSMLLMLRAYLDKLDGEDAPGDEQKSAARQGRFAGKVAVVTGGAHGIGRAIAEAFEAEGARVHVIDVSPGDWFVGDIADPRTLERFAASVIRESGRVDYLVNNAPPPMLGIDRCGWDEFSRALAVGVSAPFYLTKLLMPHFGPGASVINLSSSRDRMSQPQTESYSAAKGGIAALTHALSISLAGRARVNSISPGWIDTTGSDIGGADALQQPVGRVGKPEDIAALALFLCSDQAGFITGENICVDGGMTRLMIYHADHGWTYAPGGRDA